MKKKSSVLLVDDHPVFRQGLLNLLEKEKNLKVVGEADDGEIAIDMVRKLSPDIVLMDISMPNLDGIEATRQIVSHSQDTKVVALSVHSEKRFVRGMLQAGAAGYILKESAPNEMIEGIRSVLAGNVYLSRSISGIVVSDYSKILSETGDVTEISSEQLLRTKLHPPRVTADIIPRARLINLLEEGRERAITLISAPAGYGKSIVASQWLEACPSPSAWVSLDESDNDLREFLTYFLAAVRNIFPSVSLKAQSLLQAVELPSKMILTRYILNDLDQVDEPFILVLDDFHSIQEDAVHDLLTELLRHPSPMLHLVLLTRHDPPLPLSNLRAYGQLTEIAVKDLRFTVEETAALLERFLRIPIEKDTAAVLENKVEGWAVGLRLAAISLGQKKDYTRVLKELKESTHFVQDYLIKEVLLHVPKVFACYLMETSILDRFCAPLCDVIHTLNGEHQESDEELTGEAFIDWLQETHLFVIPLDEKHQWFRFHHLFQELLQDQLKQTMEPHGINTLHSKASDWFAGSGFIDEAIQYAMASGDVVGAAQLIEQNRQAILNNDRWYVFEKWLSHLPDTIVQQRPGLLLAKAWTLLQRFKWLDLMSVVDTAESLLGTEPEAEPMRGEIYFFRGYILFLQNEGERSVQYLKDAMELIPTTHHEVRGQAEMMYGLSSQLLGYNQEAQRTLKSLLYDGEQPLVIRQSRLLVTLVFMQIIAGDLTVALATNQQFHDVCVNSDFVFARTWSEYLMGLIHYYRNDLQKAISHFSRAMEDRYVSHTRAAIDSMAGLAFSYHATHQPDRAGTTLQSLFKYVDPLDEPGFLLVVRSSQVRISIIRGELESAIDWLKETPPPAESMLFWLEIPSVTYCRALLVEGSGESIEKAEAKLKELLKFNQDNHNICHMIHVLTLLAVAYQKQAKTEEALSAVEKAIELAQPGGFIRPFLDLGAPMIDLLKQLHKQNVAEDYIGRILTAFKHDEQHAAQEVPSRQVASGPNATPVPDYQGSLLVEDLTQRELDVIVCLAEGLSNKEIGSKLFLSALTVKKHLYNIYQKLDAHSRTVALNKARELGILPRN